VTTNAANTTNLNFTANDNPITLLTNLNHNTAHSGSLKTSYRAVPRRAGLGQARE